MAGSWIDTVWYGTGAGPSLARASLAPLAVAYDTVMSARNAWYDRAGHARPTAVPALSVGNLSVGGTGKTPMSAWCAARLQAMGASPAIVLRGYGDDEPAVHRILNPQVPVIATPDRVLGTARARSSGADVVVLDDAFQHRRAARVADLVLLSADRWRADAAVLPAGPWRESPAGLRRATVLVVTRKAATRAAAAAVAAWAARQAPRVPVAHVQLVFDALVRADTPDDRLSLAALGDADVVAVAGVGDPQAFAAQLSAAGARVTLRAFADHHPYTERDVADLVRLAGTRLVVTTLKDAVKLSPRWPRTAPPLRYVSQRVVVEDGGAALDGALAAVLAARVQSPVVPTD